MSVIEEFTLSTLQWLTSNTANIIYSAAAAAVLYAFYRFSRRQLERLEAKSLLDETASFVLKRLFQWSSTLALIAFVIAQFGIKIDLIAGLLVLAGGTVIGFAAMNTLGNAIAGLIIMTSRPFRIGDRLNWKGRYVDVKEINLIYTKMTTPDNTTINVPNQTLLQTEIENYGKDTPIRRRYAVTAGHGDDPETVRRALLEAADSLPELLPDPQPYVWTTDLQDYAVEYTLYAYIDDPKKIQAIDAAARASILESCRRHGIDISTPTLIRGV